MGNHEHRLRTALAQYQRIDTETGVVDADPHRLIQLLLDGAIDRIAQAKGALLADDFGSAGEFLGKAIGIIGGLQSVLNKEDGGEIAERLDALYDYMSRRLLDMHVDRDVSPLDEVSSLLGTIKTGWDEIRPAALQP